MRLAAVVFVAVVVGRVAAAPSLVRYEGERVTASLAGVPVGEAIAALAQATGAEVRGAVRAPRDLTIELDAVPLEEALARLLGPQSFTVVYGEDGRPRTIVLRGGPEAPSAPPERPPAAGVPVAAPEPTFPLVLGRMFDRRRPLPLSQPLAERYGEKELTFAQLLEVATIDDDGITRGLATQVVLSALERQGRYRRAFLRSLHRLAPEELEAIATGPSGERFQELLEFLAAHSREPGLQKKAGVVLDQLREAGEG